MTVTDLIDTLVTVLADAPVTGHEPVLIDLAGIHVPVGSISIDPAGHLVIGTVPAEHERGAA